MRAEGEEEGEKMKKEDRKGEEQIEVEEGGERGRGWEGERRERREGKGVERGR
jgi:hypothetical protein